MKAITVLTGLGVMLAGCINVQAEFFDAHLLPVFSAQAAAIYVLPDQLTLEQVFGSLP